MSSIINDSNSRPVFKEINVENGQAHVLLEANNKSYRVTVKGSDALLKDEAAVKEIASKLLLLANVYDLGGKTQALTLKKPTDLGKTILEQKRTTAKEGKSELVTTHEGKDLIDILEKRKKKLDQKIEDQAADASTSKSNAQELKNKLESVIDALQKLRGSNSVDKKDVDFSADGGGSNKTVTTQKSNAAQNVDGDTGSKDSGDSDKTIAIKKKTQEKRTDVKDPEEKEEALLSRQVGRKTTPSKKQYEAIIVTDNSTPPNPPAPPQGPRVSVPPPKPPPPPPPQGSVPPPAPPLRKKTTEPKASQTSTSETSTQKSENNRTDFLAEIKKGTQLKKREITNAEQKETSKKPKPHPLTEAIEQNEAFVKVLANRRAAIEPEPEDEEEEEEEGWEDDVELGGKT